MSLDMLQLLLDSIANLYSTYVGAAYCYHPSSAVCLSVCHTSEPWSDPDAVCIED